MRITLRVVTDDDRVIHDIAYSGEAIVFVTQDERAKHFQISIERRSDGPDEGAATHPGT